jgi:cation-transporting ATPase 13A1
VEKELIFAGFLIFYCPLKPDSKASIDMLNNSSHRTVMITGDNALTACHIAKEVGIIKRETMIADVWDDEGSHNFGWRTIDEKIRIKSFDFKDHVFNVDLKKYDLSVTGQGLMMLIDQPCFTKLLPRIWVYARVSPSQKELVLTKLKEAGYFTLMCGDGFEPTNNRD